jgi:molybdate transport system substrate-binding protein
MSPFFSWMQATLMSAALALVAASAHAADAPKAATKGDAPLQVAVAASAAGLVDALADAFVATDAGRASPRPRVTSSATGKLAAQIRNGAPFDVLFAADVETPAALAADGHATGKPETYALGTLVVWSRAPLADPRAWDTDAGAESALAALVAARGVKKIAIANPEVAPYGKAAMRAFDAAAATAAAKPKLVYGESIGQVTQFIAADAVDAAITAKAIVVDTAHPLAGAWAPLPTALTGAIEHAVVVLAAARKAGAAREAAARAFVAFARGPAGRALAATYGYAVP